MCRDKGIETRELTPVLQSDNRWKNLVSFCGLVWPAFSPLWNLFSWITKILETCSSICLILPVFCFHEQKFVPHAEDYFCWKVSSLMFHIFFDYSLSVALLAKYCVVLLAFQWTNCLNFFHFDSYVTLGDDEQNLLLVWSLPRQQRKRQHIIQLMFKQTFAKEGGRTLWIAKLRDFDDGVVQKASLFIGMRIPSFCWLREVFLFLLNFLPKTKGRAWCKI